MQFVQINWSEVIRCYQKGFYSIEIQILIINYKVFVIMYSKYLDYTQTAIKSHQLAQVENEQKDVLINELKKEVYQLRQLEADYLRLNDLIAALQDKYSLLIDEKQRSEKEQRVKTDIDRNTILDLKEQIDSLKVNVQKASVHIDDLLRDNTAMKRMCDTRSTEIQNLRYEIKAVQNKNQRSNQQNKSLAITVKGLKEQRKRLEEDCDTLSALLDENIMSLKNLEKQVRNQESTNARLDKTLRQAQNDNVKLVSELKQRNDEAKRAQNKLKSLKNTIAEMELTYNNLDQQANRNKQEMDKNIANLNNQVSKGKQLSARLNEVEANIRIQENELDIIISEEQKLRKAHFLNLDKNKSLNGEIDRLLALIAEYEQVNKELVDEVTIYIDQDEQAREILNRRESMTEIIEGTRRKIALTAEPIKHLKC